MSSGILEKHTVKQSNLTAEQREKLDGVKASLQPLSGYADDYYSGLLTGNIEGLYSGFPLLDENLLGLRQTIVLAGAAKSGKTSFCTQLVKQISEFNGDKDYIEVYPKKGNAKKIKEKQAVLFYSLEMPKADLTTKIISQLANIGYWDIKLTRRPFLEDHGIGKTELTAPGEPFQDYDKEKERRLYDAEQTRAKMSNVFIRDITDYNLDPTKDGQQQPGTDKPALTFERVKEEIDAVRELTGADKIIVFIDHLQVWTVPADKYRDQIDKEGYLIKNFNAIALDKKVTMFLISQTNKESLKTAEDMDFSDPGKINYDGLLAAVKGSVDIVYLATGIWSLLKTGMRIGKEAGTYELGKKGKIKRDKIELQILLLATTERQAASRVYFVLYDPIKQRFSLHLPSTDRKKYDKLHKELEDVYHLTENEIKEFLNLKKNDKPSAPRRDENKENIAVIAQYAKKMLVEDQKDKAF